MSLKSQHRTATAPVLKFRYAAIASLVVAFAIAAPLLMVGKQVYMRNLAIRCEQLSDSVYSYNREIGQLVLRCQSLATPQRIEQIAREKLDMTYPGSDQIVIVEPSRRSSPRRAGTAFFAFIRKSFGSGRG